MIVRIVKMKFETKNIALFKSIFEQSMQNIRAFSGCNFLELYQDKNDETIFFTYSFWDEESDLEAYRNSDFFRSVWEKTKPLFSEKTNAWSVTKIASLP